ncbi:LamB/YcsF family protein [Pirellulimonas nuda]|uniref:LamB/YcsF family protein n=1 Tax=Pirellulimonas nuda TaxID=2528009 RepID=A0A518D6T0_9BACT|nr:5-oxoprolinase subunit PxpA [Pirellulimonas nuda]QDU87187.1 LamB/YcsF family protein [Pirellulimonas nuda]
MPDAHPPLAIDLNADVGEGEADDARLIPLLSSASIACGGHAGDPASMRLALERCAAAGVSVGAHPGYEDRAHFGRRPLDLAPAEVEALVARQLNAFLEAADGAGVAPRHVKPHGALYNQAMRDPALAEAIVRAVAASGRPLSLFGLPGSTLQAAAAEAGLPFVREAFADRAYLADGTLAPRSTPGAVLTDPEQAVAQAQQIIAQNRADSICIHSDTPGAVKLAQRLRQAFRGPLDPPRGSR